MNLTIVKYWSSRQSEDFAVASRKWLYNLERSCKRQNLKLRAFHALNCAQFQTVSKQTVSLKYISKHQYCYREMISSLSHSRQVIKQWISNLPPIIWNLYVIANVTCGTFPSHVVSRVTYMVILQHSRWVWYWFGLNPRYASCNKGPEMASQAFLRISDIIIMASWIQGNQSSATIQNTLIEQFEVTRRVAEQHRG